VAGEHDEPGRREPERFDDPDETAMRSAVERFRRATEQAGAGCDDAVTAHAEACAARARWFPSLADRIADASQACEARRDAFADLAQRSDRNPDLVEAAQALDHAQRRVDALRRICDDAVRAETTRASMIETARRVEEAARSREWHKGDSAALPPPDDWREVG
jgi:hypothetical protein